MWCMRARHAGLGQGAGGRGQTGAAGASRSCALVPSHWLCGTTLLREHLHACLTVRRVAWLGFPCALQESQRKVALLEAMVRALRERLSMEEARTNQLSGAP